MRSIPNNIVRQLLILGIIITLGIILYFQLQTFLPAFLGAYTLYVLMRKYMFVLENTYKWRKSVCAAILMLLSFLIILLPVFILINLTFSRIGYAMEHSSELIESLQRFIQRYETQYGIQVMTPANMEKLTTWGAETLPQIIGGTLNTFISIVVMYFILYFMLTEGKKMESHFYEWVPLKDENVIMLRTDLNRLVLSNAIGIPLIALAQGVVGIIGYILIGVPQPLFWFVLTCIAGMLPVLGAALAYVPLSILLLVNGDHAKGIITLAFGLLVIGIVDNVFRFWLQKKIGDVHPLITVFGVIIGVSLFGFIGLIFGPILISLFILLIRVYVNEFSVRKHGESKT